MRTEHSFKESLGISMLLVSLFLFSGAVDQQSVRAQSKPVNTELFKVLDSVYNYNFDGASQLIKRLPDEEISEQVQKGLLEIFLIRWQYVPAALSTKSIIYEKTLLKNQEVLGGYKSEEVYYKIANDLFLAEYHASLNDPWQAIKFAKEAYPYVLKCLDGRGEPEHQFIKGLYLYYIAHYTDKNIFYRAALWPLRKGNKDQGLKELANCAAVESMAQIESIFYSAHILLRFEKRPKEALFFSTELIKRFPRNLKFRELYIENLLACRKYSDAIPLISVLSTHKDSYYACAGKFFQGLVEENYYGNLEKAEENYRSSKNTGNSAISSIHNYQEEATSRLMSLQKKRK